MFSTQVQEEILTRMRRIEGQARGVQRMISEDRDCLEILTQLASLRSAAYSVYNAAERMRDFYFKRARKKAIGLVQKFARRSSG